MKTSITKGLRRGFRAAGIGAAVAVAIGFTSVGAANADTFVPPLQDGSITQTLPGDVVVTVSTTGESANINPSMGSTPPVHRNVWVSGSAQVKLSGAGARTSTTSASCRATLWAARWTSPVVQVAARMGLRAHPRRPRSWTRPRARQWWLPVPTPPTAPAG